MYDGGRGEGAYASCQRSINSVDADDAAMTGEASVAWVEAANVASIEAMTIFKNCILS